MNKLRLLHENEAHLIKDDPVRDHLLYHWRTSAGREVYVLEKDDNSISAVICVGYVNNVPITEQELDLYSQAAYQDGQHGNIAIFYTVWSYSKGAGREIVLSVANYIKENKPVDRFVTLSPLTEMAEKFHIRNGAKLIDKGNTCQNFEYTL